MANLLTELDSSGIKALRYFQKRGYDLYFSTERGCYVRKFYENGFLVTESLVKDLEPMIDYYIKDFFPSWGKSDWCLEYLDSLQSSKDFEGFNVLEFVFKDICNIQTSTLESLEELQSRNVERLSLVDSNIKYEPKLSIKKFYYDSQIEEAKKSSKLRGINSYAFSESKLNFVNKILAEEISKIDSELMSNKLYGLLRVSSSTRSIMQQKLYRALGYPALEFSYHNIGMAFDLALSHERFFPKDVPENWGYYINHLGRKESKIFYEYLQEGISFSQLFRLYIGYYDNKRIGYTSKKIVSVNNLALKNIPLNLETLLKEGVLDAGEPLLQIYNILNKKSKLKIIDETPFFSVNSKSYIDSKNNKVCSKLLLPVLHCQMVI